MAKILAVTLLEQGHSSLTPGSQMKLLLFQEMKGIGKAKQAPEAVIFRPITDGNTCCECFLAELT